MWSVEGDVGEFDGHDELLRYRLVVGVADVDHPGARYDDAVDLIEVRDVVGSRRTTGDVDLVVAATDEAVVVDVEHLGGTVGADGVGIAHVQSPPPLPVLGPRLAFFG